MRLPSICDQDENSTSAVTPDPPPPPRLCPSITPIFFPLPLFPMILHQHYMHPSPPPALHPFTLNHLSPYPQKNSDNSRGKFIRSKNKHVSVSLLLPWHIPQGCGALWMALSVHFVWRSIHTFSAHTTHKKRYFQQMLKKQLSPLYCSFVITAPPPPAPKPIWPRSRPVVKNPAAVKCLLRLPNFLLRKDHSSTIHLIHNLRGSVHKTTTVANRP